jgi:thymidylate kinase
MSAKQNGNRPAYGFIVALEGPCCAGKTTLSRALLATMSALTISHVECYADHVGGGRFLPRPIPQTPAEDQDGLRVLLDIEADRTARSRAGRSDLVLIDRSVYTLIAHRAGLERTTDLTLRATAEGIIATSTAPLWPDLVAYLDVPQSAVHARNRGKFPADSVFINADFNDGVKDYFADVRLQGPSDVMWLDATMNPALLARTVQARIEESLSAT